MDDAKAMAGAVPILRDLIDQYGVRHVLATLARVLVARPKTPKVGALPDYLRRDIGLPPLEQGPNGLNRYR
jgi:hypothetical protein